MSIRFACRNGHLLKADVRHAGRKMKCPRCRVSVWVPQPSVRKPRARSAAHSHGTLTDTQAVRLLGSYHPSQKNLLATPAPTPAPNERQCPKCAQHVPSLCRICPSCNAYLGASTP